MIKAFVSTALLSLILIPFFTGCAPIASSSSSESEYNDSSSSIEEEIEVTAGTDGLTYEMDKNGEFAICTGIGTATDADIVIASHYEGVLVEQIATSAFNGNAFIESVEIPEGVKIINQKAFFQCAALTTVEISSTVTEIGMHAFRNCPKLDSVTIADDNDLTKINLNAFEGCSSLTTFIIGDNSALTTIADYAFLECKKMTTFELGKNSQLKEIGYKSFQYADGLSKFFIPKSVEIIGGYALGGIGYDEGNGYQSTWIYVEAKSTGILWDGFWNSSNAHVVYERSYDDYLNDRK